MLVTLEIIVLVARKMEMEGDIECHPGFGGLFYSLVNGCCKIGFQSSILKSHQFLRDLLLLKCFVNYDLQMIS